jgi:uncharacterized protein (DUF1778 family)
MASTKSERIVVRLTPEDRALLERAAAADELELSTWVRRIALQTARRWAADVAARAQGGDSDERAGGRG